METIRENYNSLKRQNGQIGGVCGGLGVYFNTNPSIIRLLFVVLFVSGVLPGLIPYLIFWLLMPKSEEGLALRVWY